MGRHRHHRQCAGTHGIPLAADAVDVRGLGEPSDLAGPLLFLASKASDFYTGHILYADGGYTAG
jgi:NAD(P)-dependent dehydrogenase (short-subunit alcohol dehydrogenase family)